MKKNNIYTNIISGFLFQGILKFKLNCPFLDKKKNKIFKINNVVWYDNWGIITSFYAYSNLPLKYDNKLFGFTDLTTNYNIENVEFEIIQDVELNQDYFIQLYSYDIMNNILPNNNFSIYNVVNLTNQTGFTTQNLINTFTQDFRTGTIQVYDNNIIFLRAFRCRVENFSNTNINITFLIQNISNFAVLYNQTFNYNEVVDNNLINIFFPLNTINLLNNNTYSITISLEGTATCSVLTKNSIYNFGDSNFGADIDLLFDLDFYIRNTIPNDGWIYINYSIIEYDNEDNELKKQAIEDKKNISL
jgi:hypothetical protein